MIRCDVLNGKISIDVCDLVEHLSDDAQCELAEHLSCMKAVIDRVTHLLIHGMTEDSSWPTWDGGVHALTVARAELADNHDKSSAEGIRAALQELESTKRDLARNRSEVWDYQTFTDQPHIRGMYDSWTRAKDATENASL